MSRLLVTGATGTVGSALVAELRGRDVAVRAFVRDAGRAAAALGGDLEPAVGDLADPISVRGRSRASTPSSWPAATCPGRSSTRPA